MSWAKKVAFAFVYTFVYFVLAVLSTGGGHGNFYLLIFAIPWFLNFVALFFVGKLQNQLYRIMFLLVMFAQYLMLMILLMNYQFSEDRGWKYGPAIFPLLWYLAGQMFLWVQFINGLMLKNEE